MGKTKGLMKVASINLLGMCALVGSAEITFEVSTLTQQLFFAQLWELTLEVFCRPRQGRQPRQARTHAMDPNIPARSP